MIHEHTTLRALCGRLHVLYNGINNSVGRKNMGLTEEWRQERDRRSPRRTSLVPPMFPDTPVVMVSPHTGGYFYEITYQGIFSNVLTLRGAEPFVNNVGNFYKTCLKTLEEQEKTAKASPWEPTIFVPVRKEEEDFVSGRNNKKPSEDG